MINNIKNRIEKYDFIVLVFFSTQYQVSTNKNINFTTWDCEIYIIFFR